jgi:hypothetical protein
MRWWVKSKAAFIDHNLKNNEGPPWELAWLAERVIVEIFAHSNIGIAGKAAPTF